MIPVVEDYGNDLGCYATPLWDLAMDLGLIASTVGVVYGIMKSATDPVTGLGVTGGSLASMIVFSYQKANVQAVENSCKVMKLGWDK